jgi:hypothetical protein
VCREDSTFPISDPQHLIAFDRSDESHLIGDDNHYVRGLTGLLGQRPQVWQRRAA